MRLAGLGLLLGVCAGCPRLVAVNPPTPDAAGPPPLALGAWRCLPSR